MTRYSDTTPGVPAQSVHLDIGNDGTIDWHVSPLFALQFDLPTFGSQPLVVRVVLDSSTVAGVPNTSVYSNTKVYLTLAPRNDVDLIRIVQGCADGAPNPPFVQPVFADRGVDCAVYLSDPTVLVFSLHVAPVVLPSSLLTPCLLLPSPDILFAAGQVHLPLPAAVRPLVFFGQGVTLSTAGLGLVTSDAWQVIAY